MKDIYFRLHHSTLIEIQMAKQKLIISDEIFVYSIDLGQVSK